MTEPKDDGSDDDAGVPKRRAGLAGTPANVGRELGELDFEADALLDSLTNQEDEPATKRSEPKSMRSGALPAGPKLHEPKVRQYGHDEVTAVTRPGDARETALIELAAELRSDEIDELDELLGTEDEKAPTPGAGKAAAPAA
ncbi:MAG TPA: hypothetical protein VGP93_02390, partial [Polyangiaceae bacterium]|nr:hypothetical protein [Polyangiaceae bacterium]